MTSFLAAAVQLTSGADPEQNFAAAEEQIELAARRGADLVGLPENFAFMGDDDQRLEQAVDLLVEGQFVVVEVEGGKDPVFGEKVVAKGDLVEEIELGEEAVTREIAVWDGNPEQTYSQEELRKVLDEAIQSLKPTFRSVFQLRDVEELSTEETAEALGLSIPAVKSRLLRARLQLRERLTRQFKRKGDDAFAFL